MNTSNHGPAVLRNQDLQRHTDDLWGSAPLLQNTLFDQNSLIWASTAATWSYCNSSRCFFAAASSGLPGSATAAAARTAAATCSYYCTKSNHFRDVMKAVVRDGAGLCRGLEFSSAADLTVPGVLRSVRRVRSCGDELVAVHATAVVVVIVVTAAQVVGVGIIQGF